MRDQHRHRRAAEEIDPSPGHRRPRQADIADRRREHQQHRQQDRHERWSRSRGRRVASLVRCGHRCRWRGRQILDATVAPLSGPPRIVAGMAQRMANTMVRPVSAPSRSIAASGPGCGGTRPWDADRPATSGSASVSSGRPDVAASPTTIGKSSTRPTLKKTGKPDDEARPPRPPTATHAMPTASTTVARRPAPRPIPPAARRRCCRGR